MKKFEILQEKILNQSESKIWEHAKREWKLNYIYENESHQECVCGHYPIKEICVIKNIKNKNQREIGNHCIKQFLGLNTSKLFLSVKKVKKDIVASVDCDTLDYAYENNFISNWDFNFYSHIRLKRILSQKQLDQKIRINEKIFEIIVLCS